MTENIDPNDIEDCQKQVADLEAEVRELRAALEAASVSVSRMTNRTLKQELRAERSEAALAMYSKIDGDDGLASVNRLLAACERGDGIDQHAAPDIMAARAEIVAQRAALDRARALANELQNYAKDKEGEMSVMMAAVAGTMRGIGDRLAALLAAAPGGAA